MEVIKTSLNLIWRSLVGDIFLRMDHDMHVCFTLIIVELDISYGVLCQFTYKKLFINFFYFFIFRLLA